VADTPNSFLPLHIARDKNDIQELLDAYPVAVKVKTDITILLSILHATKNCPWMSFKHCWLRVHRLSKLQTKTAGVLLSIFHAKMDWMCLAWKHGTMEWVRRLTCGTYY
jgi:hypothetical protein